MGGVAAAAPIVTGIMGASANKKAMAAAQAAMERATAIIEETGMPPDLSAPVIIQELRRAGIYNPEMEAQINTAVSKVSQIQEDKSLRDTQVQALQNMSRLGKAGLTPDERAQMNQARQAVQRDLEAKQQQIIQNMQMRGQSGSGAELAARLGASQAGADRASEEGDRISALAQARALQAIQSSSNMAGGLRSQDFDVESTKAGAADEFERFNIANQIGTQQRNVSSQNAAQLGNLQESQRIADTNVGMANQEKYRQNQAKRDFWQDKLAYNSARAGIASNAAQYAGAQDKANAQMWSGIGAGVGSGLGSIGNYLNQQQMFDLYKQQVANNKPLAPSPIMNQPRTSSYNLPGLPDYTSTNLWK